MAPRVRAAFQGELGAYSHEALLTFFGGEVEPVPCRSFPDVARRIDSGEAEMGLLPVENTLAGSVVGSYDVLAAGHLRIIGEVIVPIHHCLLGTSGTSIESLGRVLSHPMALAQCQRFLARHPAMESVPYYDTAGAAREVARRADVGTGAIASRTAAARYRLRVLDEEIEDRSDNQTRFFVLAPADHIPPAQPGEAGRRTTLVLLAELADEPGALVRLLSPLAERGLNLRKLESRPAGSPWRYRFFLELEGPQATIATHPDWPLADRTTRFRILGTFPAAS